MGDLIEGGRPVDDLRSLLLEHAKSGEILWLAGPGVRPDSGEDKDTPWPPSQHVPAAALRDALLRLQRDPNLADPRGLRIVGAEIVEPLELDGLSVLSPLALEYSRVRAGASLAGIELPRLSLRGSHVHPGVGGTALNLDGARITGGMILDDGFTATGMVRALRATIGGDLTMDGATLTNKHGDALNLDGTHLSGFTLLRNGLTTGVVRAVGATIGGPLVMDGATLTNKHGDALNLDGARTGVVLLRNGCTTGMVRAVGATIGGSLEMDGATLTNKRGAALVLDGARITSAVTLRNEFTATGEVRAKGATIGGDFDMEGATLTSKHGEALTLDGAQITGDVLLRNEFTATGEVRAKGATIGGDFDMDGAALQGGDATVLNLGGAQMTTLRLSRLVVEGDGVVDVRSSKIGALTFYHIGRDKPVPAGDLIANGWHVTTILGAMASDSRPAQEWLDTRPPWVPYSPQPARVLADVYEKSGHPDQARKLRYTAAVTVANHAPWPAKGWQLTYRWLVGHGYYPLRTIWWLIGLFAATVLIAGTNQAAFVPSDSATATDAAIEARDTANPKQEGEPLDFTITAATPCDQLGAYPCFEPWPYALQTVIPPASAIQANPWQPTGRVLIAMTLFKAAGWILVVLFLASISGLLRRT
jgi:hypothetical protein